MEPVFLQTNCFQKSREEVHIILRQNIKSSKTKKQPRALDVSEVIDFKAALESFNRNGNLPSGLSVVGRDFDNPVFFLEKRPAAKERKLLVKEESDSVVTSVRDSIWKIAEEGSASSGGDILKSISASVFVCKLRWSTLGLQFDWSKGSYNLSLPHNKLPCALCQLAKKMAAPPMRFGEEFNPEAAIVNSFGSGDMLGGHLDGMEEIGVNIL